MKKYLFRISQLAIAIAVFVVLQKCGTDTGINANDTFISGTITFVNQTPALTSAYYAVSFFWADSSNPFGRTPARSDSLPISSAGGSTSIYFKSTGLVSSNYFVGCSVINSSDKQILGVLGTFGCDTSHTCAAGNHETSVQFPNYAGNGTTNFISWTQLGQRIH